MATISRSGITAGGTISPTHITNIIDALDGTGVGITVVATGSFTGSLVGTATTATTASYVLQAVSASFATRATSASFATSATTASYAPPTFPYTGSARITGSLAVTGSTSLSGSLDGNLLATNNLIFNLSQLGRHGGSGSFVVPTQVPTSIMDGTLYWDSETSVLYIFSAPAGQWTYMQFN